MSDLRPVSLPIEAALEARLIRRYKRFLADIRLPDGSERTVHCPNPGSMLGTCAPGSAVRCSTHDGARRKLRHTLEMIRVGRVWVGLHAARANDVVARALGRDAYAPFAGYAEIAREAKSPEGSRFDFRLSGRVDDERPCWIEVKSVTLCEARRARFPDAVTLRGRRHLEHLMARRSEGDRAALLYVVQRGDADSVAPAEDIDPAYATTLREAARAGVEVHALSARVLRDRIRLERALPVELGAPAEVAAPSDTTRGGIRKIRAPLLRWYDANRRDLPWRDSDDPYAIWISEAMLQQTRVETVIPYWARFLDRFPDVTSLARAELDDVYAVWTGLGYYSRARNLKRAAETIVAEHAGRLPDTVEELQRLQGIGRYTAGAIASIAFDREAPLVDGNVIRVFTRVLGIHEDSASKSVVDRIWTVAGELVKGRRPGDLNQALMELGATLCTPRKPHCLACPIRRHCRAHAAGDAESLPIKHKKTKVRRMRAVAALIECGDEILAVRRPEQGLMAGLWELPGGSIEANEEPKDRVAPILRDVVGLDVGDISQIGRVEHLFTHRRLELEVFRCRLREVGASGPDPTARAKRPRVRRKGFVAHRWLAAEALLDLAHAGPTRKALVLAGLTEEGSARAAGKR